LLDVALGPSSLERFLRVDDVAMPGISRSASVAAFDHVENQDVLIEDPRESISREIGWTVDIVSHLDQELEEITEQRDCARPLRWRDERRTKRRCSFRCRAP